MQDESNNARTVVRPALPALPTGKGAASDTAQAELPPATTPVLTIDQILGPAVAVTPLYNAEAPHHVLILYEDSDKALADEIAQGLLQDEVPYYVGAYSCCLCVLWLPLLVVAMHGRLVWPHRRNDETTTKMMMMMMVLAT